MKRVILIFLCTFTLLNSFCENIIDLADSEIIAKNIKIQYNSLTQNERILLNRVKVILEKPENSTIPIREISGTVFSTVCISTDLISEPLLNYKISHYIRNQLVNTEEQYIFLDYDTFVKSNSKRICEVIYYIYHKSYYGIYKIYSSESDNFFYDDRLGNEIVLLKEKLKQENSLFLYGF